MFILTFGLRILVTCDKVVSEPSGVGRTAITWEVYLLLGGQRGQGFLLAWAVS